MLRPKGDSTENLALIRRIDKLFLESPFYGSRQMDGRAIASTPACCLSTGTRL